MNSAGLRARPVSQRKVEDDLTLDSTLRSTTNMMLRYSSLRELAPVFLKGRELDKSSGPEKVEREKEKKREERMERTESDFEIEMSLQASIAKKTGVKLRYR